MGIPHDERNWIVNTLKLPAVMENFDPAMDFIRDESAKAGFDNSLVNKIALASEEAVVNVIHYAYPEGGGDFEIVAKEPEGKKGLHITLTDSGQAFDPLKKEDPDINAPVEERPIGGLGIFMIQKIMDEVRYERKDDQNILTMVKYL